MTLDIFRRTKLILNFVKRREFRKILNLLKNKIGVISEPLKANYLPILVAIEPTNYCNLKCTTCINKNFVSNRRDMSLDEFKEIIKKIPYLKEISLAGVGEPLMNKDLFEMIRYAKEKNIEIRLITNATLLDKKKAVGIIESGVDRLGFSVDSPVKETYEKIRIGANFEKLKENIKQFVSIAKGQINSDILVVVTKENFNELNLFIPLLKEIGINRLNFQSMQFWGSEEFKLKMGGKVIEDYQGIVAYIRKIKHDALQDGIVPSFLNMPDIQKGRKCKWPWRMCFISVEGFVTPCCLGGANPETLNFGNISKFNNFNDIWNGKKYINFRKALKSKDPPFICTCCPNYYSPKTV